LGERRAQLFQLSKSDIGDAPEPDIINELTELAEELLVADGAASRVRRAGPRSAATQEPRQYQ
jgi:hypothetical protein